MLTVNIGRRCAKRLRHRLRTVEVRLFGVGVDADVVLAAEGTDLASVEADLARVVRKTPDDLLEYLRSTGKVTPAVVDALFALLRSQATTHPALRPAITKAGQIASDLLARRAGAGRVSHPVLRIAAWIPRRLLWKRINPTR